MIRDATKLSKTKVAVAIDSKTKAIINGLFPVTGKTAAPAAPNTAGVVAPNTAGVVAPRTCPEEPAVDPEDDVVPGISYNY